MRPLVLLCATALVMGLTTADTETAAPTTIPPAGKTCSPKDEMMYQQCSTLAKNDSTALCKCVSQWGTSFKNCEPRSSLGYSEAKASCAGASGTSSGLPSTLPAQSALCNPKLQMLYQECISKSNNDATAICKCVQDSAFNFKDCQPRESLGYQSAKATCDSKISDQQTADTNTQKNAALNVFPTSGLVGVIAGVAWFFAM